MYQKTAVIFIMKFCGQLAWNVE